MVGTDVDMEAAGGFGSIEGLMLGFDVGSAVVGELEGFSVG